MGEEDPIKWPLKVKHNGFVYEYYPTFWDKYTVHYRRSAHERYRDRTEGKISLPKGWQDMDRTYTAQDIYWEDKYDCRIMQERVLLKG